MATTITWTTEEVRLGDLKPFKGNPRSMSQKQREDLGAKLGQFRLRMASGLERFRIEVSNERVGALIKRPC